MADWEFIQGRSRRAAIEGVEGPKGEFLVGDTVKLGNFYGIISSFQRSSRQKRVRILCLNPGSEPSQLILTTAFEYKPIEDLDQKIEIVSQIDFDPAVGHFYCSFGVNSQGKATDDFDWNEFKGLSAQEISEKLSDKFRSLFETPRKRRTITLAETPTPKKLYREPTPDSESDWSAPASPTIRKNEPMASSPKALPHTPSKTGRRARSLPSTPRKHVLDTPHMQARSLLHVSSIPEELPCREHEFSQLFVGLESAIRAGTGTCIYISGTPGVGKTATVREAISQLDLRRQEGELPEFVFLELNGMKLTHPNIAYDLLWKELSPGRNMSSLNAMTAIEALFSQKNAKRPVLVVLMDELDQLVTKNLGVLYNLFNWPALPHSKLIVIAVANTMDLPERILTNKISSRLGLTRIQFKGYTYAELRQIIFSRLEGVEIVEADALEYVARKVAGVSGDARRALDLCRRAVELGDGTRINIEHIREAINESQHTPMALAIASYSAAAKVLLCAIVLRVKRTSNNEVPVHEALSQAEKLVKMSDSSSAMAQLLYNGTTRLRGFQYSLQELVEAGILAQQAIKGEAAPNVRLLLAGDIIKSVLENDEDVGDMI